MPIIEIMYSDLSEPKQKLLLESAGVTTPEEMNWEIVPITIFEIENENQPNED